MVIYDKVFNTGRYYSSSGNNYFNSYLTTVDS